MYAETLVDDFLLLLHTRTLLLNFLPPLRIANIFTWQRWLAIRNWLTCVNHHLLQRKCHFYVQFAFFRRNTVINEIVFASMFTKKYGIAITCWQTILSNHSSTLIRHKLIWFWIKIALWYRLHILFLHAVKPAYSRITWAKLFFPILIG